MLAELCVSDLGVIEQLSLVLGPSMTALTGETGAGKTLIVGALELLLGARADATLVRAGADEARVDARFVVDDDETVLSRVVPREGRTRAYVDGRPVPLGVLAERAHQLVDLHGQHAHQSLLRPAAQRDALDTFGDIDVAPVRAARAALRDLDDELAGLGGDTRSRAREIDLVRFQVNEIDAASIAGPDEDDRLDDEESLLADALAHREAAVTASEALGADGGARDALSSAVAALASRKPFAAVVDRLRPLLAELDDVTTDVRGIADRLEDDPARLADVRARRQLLRDLCRKYGDDLGAVLAFADQARGRLHELETHDERAAALDARRAELARELAAVEAAVWAQRRTHAPALAQAIEANLRDLAMTRARLEVAVDDGAGEVSMLLAANVGSPVLPLAKVASGGELARAMLAVRLTLLGLGPHDGGLESGTPAPDTLVFDEVDAGIGGEAATAVGRALAALARDRQVLVVTHLAQVAAFADAQFLVAKEDDGDRTRTTVRVLNLEDRVIELSRMLSGRPDSRSARQHATELLDERDRGRRPIASSKPAERGQASHEATAVHEKSRARRGKAS